MSPNPPTRSLDDLRDEFFPQLCKLKCLRHASELLLASTQDGGFHDARDISHGLYLLYGEVIDFFEGVNESLDRFDEVEVGLLMKCYEHVEITMSKRANIN